VDLVEGTHCEMRAPLAPTWVVKTSGVRLEGRGFGRLYILAWPSLHRPDVALTAHEFSLLIAEC